MSDQQHLVFLSHNNDDKPAVEAIAEQLREKQLTPWLDKWNLIPGRPWQPEIERALGECGSCAVFIGPSGMGPWQHEEMRLAIDRRVNSPDFAVIPVLLPGVDRPQRSELPGFLTATTWVEYRRSLDEAEPLRRLIYGIRGEEPRPIETVATDGSVRPYRGLRQFREEDARFFFGREALTEWLVAALRPRVASSTENRLLAVVGASGSGKSSLVRAGLIPALRGGAMEGSEHWLVLDCRPGAEPLESLAITLAAAPALGTSIPDEAALIQQLLDSDRTLHLKTRRALHGQDESQRIVLYVDQFEEVFTLCEDDPRRRAFIENLLYASTIARGQTVVLLSMRADFYGHCAAYPRLRETFAKHNELVGPLTPQEMHRAIERPAQMVGCELEPGLPELLIRDVGNEPGRLPLLQHALSELWERREGRRLTYAAYERIGHLEGALEQHADAVFNKLPPVEQDICRRVFLRLTQLGRGTEDTRRRVFFTELLSIGGEPHAVERLLLKLADERLATTSDQGQEASERTVEVAHEALIRCWKRLRDWIDQRRESLVLRGELEDAARRWKERGRDVSVLYHGLTLQEAEQLARDPEIDLGPNELAFLDASVGHFVEQLTEADTSRVPDLAAELQPLIARARPFLETVCSEQPADSRARLHAALALLPTDPKQLAYLRERLLGAELEDLFVIADALAGHHDGLVAELWRELVDDTSARAFRSALVLAKYDPPSDAARETRWQPHVAQLAERLVDEVANTPSRYPLLLSALRPIRALLLAPLSAIFRNDADDRRRGLATSFLADYAANEPELLGDLILDADTRQFQVLLERLRPHGERGTGRAKSELQKSADSDASEDAKEVLAKRQANAAAVLLRLDQEQDAWPAFRHSPDPRARSYLIHRVSPLQVSPHLLIERLDDEKDVSVQRALLLALGEFTAEQLPPSMREEFIPSLCKLYETHLDPGLHAASEWLLRSWGRQDRILEIRAALRGTDSHQRERFTEDGRRRYVTDEDHTFVVVEASSFLMGSPESDPHRRTDEILHRRDVQRRFAISAAPVTREQYRRFEEESGFVEMAVTNHDQITAVIRTEDSPITGMTWYEAAAYCNWLSEHESIPRDQLCYEPNTEGKFLEGMRAKPGYLSLTGYRLPSEAEWKFACRAGSETRRYYGHSDATLRWYAWYMENAENHAWPIGQLKPNDFGLFDILGNVFEWCHNRYFAYAGDTDDTEDGEFAKDRQSRVLRGGSFSDYASLARSAYRNLDHPGNRGYTCRFRPARTYP